MSTGTAESRAGLLEGRNVLVTGGSSGIGRGIATVCAREGARVAFTYSTNAEGADATLAIVRQHGTGLAIRADLRDRAAPARVVAEVEEAWGGIDVLVNNAAVSEVVPFPLLEDADWDELMELNVNAVFRLSRAAARGMLRRKYGRIVNIGSIAGARAIASPVHYATSKGALEGMTRSLAHELGPYGILVNCIAAGIFEGGLRSTIPEHHQKRYVESCALGRIGQPQRVWGARRLDVLGAEHLPQRRGRGPRWRHPCLTPGGASRRRLTLRPEEIAFALFATVLVVIVAATGTMASDVRASALAHRLEISPLFRGVRRHPWLRRCPRGWPRRGPREAAAADGDGPRFCPLLRGSRSLRSAGAVDPRALPRRCGTLPWFASIARSSAWTRPSGSAGSGRRCCHGSWRSATAPTSSSPARWPHSSTRAGSEARALFRDYIVAGSLTAVLGFVGYLLVPAVGPYVFQADLFPTRLPGGAYAPIFIKAVDDFRGVARDCFPSLHAAHMTVALVFAYRFRLALFLVMLPVGLGLYVSTIYLRMHYVTDVAAGVALASLAVFAAPRINRLMGTTGR